MDETDERDEPDCFTSVGALCVAILEKLIPVTEANCVTDHDTQHAGCRGYGETEGEDEKSVGEGHGSHLRSDSDGVAVRIDANNACVGAFRNWHLSLEEVGGGLQ